MTEKVVVDERLTQIGELAGRVLFGVGEYVLGDEHVEDSITNKLESKNIIKNLKKKTK